MEFPELNPIGKGNTLVVCGHVYNANYQRAKWLLENIVKKRLSREFKSPCARGLYENEFRQQLWCFQHGIGDVFWTCQTEVLVFVNGVYIGDDECLRQFLNRIFVISLIVPSLKSPEIQAECKRDFLDLIAKDTTGKFVYLDIGIDGEYIGSLVIRLYINICPMSCDHFLQYVQTSLEEKQNYGKPGYIQTKIHRICLPSFLQCGDIQEPTPIFSDECFDVVHDRRGIVSFSNVGPDSNKCQFIISLNPNPWMDRKYVAFGEVVEGMGVLDRIEAVPTFYESPEQDIEILDCGTLPLPIDSSREFSIDGNMTNKSEEPSSFPSMNFYDLQSIPDESDLQLDMKQMLVDEITKLSLPVRDQPHPEDIRSDLLDLQRYLQGLYTMPKEIQVCAQNVKDTFQNEAVEEIPCKPNASGIDPKYIGKYSRTYPKTIDKYSGTDTKQYYSLIGDNHMPYAGLPEDKLAGKTDEEILRLFDNITITSDVTESSYVTDEEYSQAESELSLDVERLESGTLSVEENATLSFGSETLRKMKDSDVELGEEKFDE